MLALLQDVANAASEASAIGWSNLGKALGAGLTVVGAAIGIGRIGGAMTERMARQPAIAGNVQTAAVTLAALIQGARLIGIGRIGGAMTESMARQPEIAGNIQTAAIILAALIEGAALFALVIAFLI